jgi:hypothetical protein
MTREQKIVTAVVLAVVAIAGIRKFTQAQPPLSPADIELSNLVISPIEVQVGQPVTISVDVTNNGETAGSAEVMMEVS